jgi:predicted enzyme related to lactoylglutathione lyase
MLRPVHFEIAADEPERAVKFYDDVFGWKTSKWDGPVDYWLVKTGEDAEGIDGGIARRRPGSVTMFSMEVPSADEFAAKVVEAGGKIVRPKSAIPGIGWIVYCEDTEGNAFSIMQDDPEAK